MAAGPVARVLVDSPLPQLDQLFDYRVPERLAGQVVAGMRVRVPLRSGGRIAECDQPLPVDAGIDASSAP